MGKGISDEDLGFKILGSERRRDSTRGEVDADSK